MAEVEMIPVADAVPPKADPLAKPVATKVQTIKAKPLLRPGLKLPPKPVIRKPGTGAAVSSILPKPIMPPKPAEAPKAVEAVAPKPMEALKSVTQKLKGITQQIPQQAVLHKTGIIADAALTEAQKEAAKHKTARISLSDAMGVAPVKNENAPMKTIKIKRPINISGATEKLTPHPVEGAAEEPAPSVTQKKTLKIARPTSKFAVKRPTAPVATAENGEVADIPDIPSAPIPPVPTQTNVDKTPAWVWTLSACVQLAACVVMGLVAWYLFDNTQTLYF